MDPHRSAFPKLLGEMGRILEARLRADGRRLFSVEGVYDNQRPAHLVAVQAGAVEEVHPVTLSVVEKQQVVDVPDGPFDCAILGVPDPDPYSQGRRAHSNPLLALNLALSYGFGAFQRRPAVRSGGALIIVHPMPWRFDDLHHPSYREFCTRVLDVTHDAGEAWDLFADDFANRPDYIHRYRHGFGFHGVHPFFMWTQSSMARRGIGRLIVAGVDDPEVPQRFGLEGFRTVEAAVASVQADLGRDCSMVLPCSGGMPMIARVGKA